MWLRVFTWVLLTFVGFKEMEDGAGARWEQTLAGRALRLRGAEGENLRI